MFNKTKFLSWNYRLFQYEGEEEIYISEAYYKDSSDKVVSFVDPQTTFNTGLFENSKEEFLDTWLNIKIALLKPIIIVNRVGEIVGEI